MRASAIWILIVVHVLGGILESCLSADEPAVSSGMLLALVFCQCSLLGMWCGLGNAHWGLRLAALLVGAFYLGGILGLGISEVQPEIFFLTAFATGLVTVVAWLVRMLKGTLTRRPTDADQADERAEPLQFTIRHLMAVTFAVACLLTLGRALAPYAPSWGLMVELILLGLCYVVVALAAMWAWLGGANPSLRSIFVLAIGVGSGLAGGYLLDGGNDAWFWSYTTALEAVFLIASLRTCRRAGYRLVAKVKS